MHLQTERLVITRFTRDMSQRIHILSLDEDNRRFVPDEVFETVQEARETVDYLIARYDDLAGPLAYAVLLDGECIGYVQLVPLEGSAWEVGYHIGREYIGCGYATEAVRAFLPEMASRLSLTEVHGVCLAENVASARVLQKCGFKQTYVGQRMYQGQMREICRSVWTSGDNA